MKEIDVIVIGGGPAGMMAAGAAAEQGAKVMLLEKNNRLGVKLLMTGNGRCNLTNRSAVKEFISKVYGNGKFLYSAMSVFGPEEVMDFFESRGLKLKVENNNRVFPKSDKATDVLAVLEGYMKEGGVKVMTDVEVLRIEREGDFVSRIVLRNGGSYKAKNYVIACGGLSYPATGSTGSGFDMAESLGHAVTGLRPGLTGLRTKEYWIGELEGLSLRDVEISAISNGKQVFKRVGDIIFTAQGLSGPTVHDISLFGTESLDVRIDLFKEKTEEELDRFLQEFFHKNGNKQLKNGLSLLIPQRLVPYILTLSRADHEMPMGEVRKEERQKIVQHIKRFKFSIRDTDGFEKANVTVGGVSLSEIEPQTIKSKLIDNLYFAGEILDLAGPSGGYNLQICFSTGHLAGKNVIL